MNSDVRLKEQAPATVATTLRPALPAGAFEPDPRSLAWLLAHLAVIAVATLVIAMSWVPWPVALVLSLIIGASFAGLTFVGHEALHGGVVRNRWLLHVVGWIGFLPFVVSPRLTRSFVGTSNA